MDIITHQQLRDLIESGQAPCVSIFMPTHREREMRQDPARLKNLVRQAEEKLIAQGMRPTLARDLLKPASDLHNDLDFWTMNQHGLALFLCEGFYRQYRLPLEVEETVMVNEHFDIKPLLPLLADKLFYVLAISVKGVRLLQGSRHSYREIELPPDVPRSITEAILPGDGRETQTVRYGGSANSPGSQAGAFHGQAQDIQQKTLEDRSFYYRQVDDGVRRVVKDANATLILAGADSTVPHYRQVAAYKNICEECIHGNAEHVTDEALHEAALKILEPIWHKELNELQEQFGTAYARHLASDNIFQIVPAAAEGRVGILFVSPENRRPGKFDAEQLLVDDRSEEEDLVDQAAVQTLMTGGQLVVVRSEDVPGKGDIAAIYRYMG